MNIETFRDYCMGKPGVTESFPFDEETIVFKVGGKIFALADVDNFNSVNLKCDPELVPVLRERYPCVQPGYHMNKKHWNTIVVDGSVSDSLLKEWIDHSYDLVFAGLPRAQKERLSV